MNQFTSSVGWDEATEYVLRGNEDIRRVDTSGGLLVADSHGIQYLVQNQFSPSAHNKKILDPFL